MPSWARTRASNHSWAEAGQKTQTPPSGVVTTGLGGGVEADRPSFIDVTSLEALSTLRGYPPVVLAGHRGFPTFRLGVSLLRESPLIE